MSDNKMLLGIGVIAFFVTFLKMSRSLESEEEEEDEEEVKVNNEKSDKLYPEGCKAENILQIESVYDFLLERYLEIIKKTLEEIEPSQTLIDALDEGKKTLSVDPINSIFKELLPEEVIDRACWLAVRFGLNKSRLIEIDLGSLSEGIVYLGNLPLKGFIEKPEEAKTTLREGMETFLKGELKTAYILKDKKIDAGSEEEKRYNEISDFILETLEGFKDKDLMVLLDVEYPEQ